MVQVIGTWKAQIGKTLGWKPSAKPKLYSNLAHLAGWPFVSISFVI